MRGFKLQIKKWRILVDRRTMAFGYLFFVLALAELKNGISSSKVTKSTVDDAFAPTTGTIIITTANPEIQHFTSNRWTHDYNPRDGIVTPSDEETARYLHNLSLAAVTSTIPWPNLTTLAFHPGFFLSGYRNQMMYVVILVLQANRANQGQILIDTINFKDTYGTNQQIPMHVLWDIEHWNSYFPAIPRLVFHDPVVHDQYNIKTRNWYQTADGNTTTADQSFNSTTPLRPFSFRGALMSRYIRYAGLLQGPFVYQGHRNPAEIIMLKEAMRPSPDLMHLIQTHLDDLTRNSTVEYMTVHARIEPDMQKHPVCRDKKVLNLTSILDFMESKWKDPPAPRIFLPLNRQYLEQEGSVNTQNPSKTNWIAVENLLVLNRIRKDGLWGGRAEVFEFGANMLKGTKFESRPSTSGAMLNFFIGINANVFVGTEVSSFSHDLLSTRFYRGKMENYKYLPDGLHEWSPPGTIDPQGFLC